MSLLLCLRGHALGAIVKEFAGLGMKGVAARASLPTPDGDIDIEGVEIDSDADAAGLLSRHDGKLTSLAVVLLATVRESSAAKTPNRL
jgi:hypothetical protein